MIIKKTSAGAGFNRDLPGLFAKTHLSTLIGAMLSSADVGQLKFSKTLILVKIFFNTPITQLWDPRDSNSNGAIFSRMP
jgi:hypothetical protein